MRCDQCKHWFRDKEDWSASAVGFGECKAVRPRWKIQDEAVAGMEWDDEGSDYAAKRANALRASRAYVQDGSEYRAELLTAPDFGCVLFTVITTV